MGKFRVVQRLSEGATAELFLAELLGSEELRLLEVLRREVKDNAEATQRFLNEAVWRRELIHPNVAKRVGYGRTTDGRPYFASEAVGGRTLGHQLWEVGPLSVEDALRLFTPLCDALEHFHRRGVVHGNLKPTSILLEGGLEAFSPKLIDYGLALYRSGVDVAPDRRRTLVPPEYLAPERVRGQRGGVGADLYALGVVLYEALSGFPPFTSAEPDETRRLQLVADPPPLPPEAAQLAPIVHRCLAKSVVERFASIGELRRALEIEARRTQGVLVLGEQVRSTLTLPPVNDTKGEERLGPYRLLQRLGEGAMGCVYLAEHEALRRKVAIKVLHPDVAKDPRHVERFFREARAVNRIHHESIVEIYDLVAAEGPDEPIYCVMELLSGKSLGEVLAEGPLPLGRSLKLVHEVCRALEAAHRVGVVHRDVKPDNIQVVPRSEGGEGVKVLDFGVAKLVRDAPEGEVNRTLRGTVIGTPTYMSPEQAMGRDVDARADVYGVGVLLYRLLAGHVPFSAPSFIELAPRIAREAPKPLPDRTPGGDSVPPSLKALVLRCLAKEPASRPKSMGEVATALAALFEKPVPVASTRPPPETRTWALFAAAVLAALVGVAAAWALLWNASEAKKPAPRAPSILRPSAPPAPPPARVVRVPLAQQEPGAPKKVASPQVMPAKKSLRPARKAAPDVLWIGLPKVNLPVDPATGQEKSPAEEPKEGEPPRPSGEAQQRDSN